MRVLYVIDALGEGGAEMSLAELLPPLAAAGISPTVVCLKSRGDEGVHDRLVDQGFDVRVLRAGRLASQVRQTAAVTRSTEPELIHTTLYQANLVGALAGARTRTPVVRSLVNTSYAPERLADPRLAAGRMRVTKVIDGFIARHLTRALHAISHAVKDHAVETLGVPADRITVVGRGRDPERLGSPSPARRQAARAMLDIAPGTEVLVNVARQEYQKGQRHLLDAMELLVSHRPHLSLIVAGRTGTVTAELQDRAASAAIADHVRFLGHRKDVPEVLSAGDVFVFPSLYEGFGGALLEAMALGLPIVASDIPAVREVVDDGGNAILVPPGDAAALAAAIDELLGDPDRRAAFAARGQAIFCDRFVLDRVAEQMLEFYAETVTRR